MAEEKSPVTAITLSGNKIHADGKITKSDYFRILGTDLSKYDDIILTPEEAESYRNYMHRLSSGAGARVPLNCAGPVCPFASTCPLEQMGKAPLGKLCPLEANLLQILQQRYLEEYDIDPNSPTLLSMISELSELEVYSVRVDQILAKPENATLVTQQTVGITPQGRTIFRTEVSPYWDLKERISGRKSKIIKLLVGDPQEKYKRDAALRQRSKEDPSQNMADLRAKIERLTHEVDGVAARSATDVTPKKE